MTRMNEMAGGHKIGFSHATYLCEHETAWRNNALVAFMQDAGVFPGSIDTRAALDFYLQCCSIETDTKSAASIAATLANSGVCPLNGRRVLDPMTVKSAVSLMFSCGMYDFSGTWMSTVGLPAKSGVAGLIYIVVPRVMGLAVFAPPLDSHGNSVRGVEFCKRLLQTYPLGIFDQLVRGKRFASMFRPLAAVKLADELGSANAPDSAANIRVEVDETRSRQFSSSHDLTHVIPSSASRAGSENGSLISNSIPGGRRVTKGVIAGVPGIDRGSTRTSRVCLDEGLNITKPDMWRRLLKLLVRMSRMLRRLRLWCGLPLTTDDIWRLLYAAASRGELDDMPEVAAAGMALSSSLSTVSATSPAEVAAALIAAQHSKVWEMAADVAFEQYMAYRSYVLGKSADFATEDWITSALAIASSAHKSAVASSDGNSSGVSGRIEMNSSTAWRQGSIEVLAAGMRPTGSALPLPALSRFMELQGISVGSGNTHICALWSQLEAACSVNEGSAEMVSVAMLLHYAGLYKSVTLLRVLSGHLAMTNFRTFSADVMGIYDVVKRKVNEGAPCPRLKIADLKAVDPELFGVAVCTVDGQMLGVGHTEVEFPLMGAVRPLLYGIACNDCGVSEVERWVGVEPTASVADTFSLLPASGNSHGGGGGSLTSKPMFDDGFFHPELARAPHPMPFNPFLDSGALVVSALVGRAHYPPDRRLFHDNGSRFSHVVNTLRKWAGGRSLGFSNSVFLAQKQKRLKTLAVSHYAKGKLHAAIAMAGARVAGSRFRAQNFPLPFHVARRHGSLSHKRRSNGDGTHALSGGSHHNQS
jgi:glutaminase